MYCARTSRALRCASSTFGSDAAPCDAPIYCSDPELANDPLCYHSGRDSYFQGVTVSGRMIKGNLTDGGVAHCSASPPFGKPVGLSSSGCGIMSHIVMLTADGLYETCGCIRLRVRFSSRLIGSPPAQRAGTTMKWALELVHHRISTSECRVQEAGAGAGAEQTGQVGSRRSRAGAESGSEAESGAGAGVEPVRVRRGGIGDRDDSCWSCVLCQRRRRAAILVTLSQDPALGGMSIDPIPGSSCKLIAYQLALELVKLVGAYASGTRSFGSRRAKAPRAPRSIRPRARRAKVSRTRVASTPSRSQSAARRARQSRSPARWALAPGMMFAPCSRSAFG